MVSVTKLTEEYIRKHKSIKDCLKSGLLNYSALARLVFKELKTKKSLPRGVGMEAVLIAARRYKHKLKLEKSSEKQILQVLRESEIEIKTKSVVLVLEKQLYPDKLIEVEKIIKRKKGLFNAIEGVNSITIITTEKYSGEIKQTFKSSIIHEIKGLVSLIVKSPKEIETTPGVMAYLYGVLSDAGINVYHTLSCWTDTFIVVSETDMSRVLELFDFS
ncbi:ACT domain-containing protein [Candidatus Woesearchaeota archaeon]|jgi:hypothetical protein|nr:ACT domain-containing protein [Candidatus Woesearchaeota archaeon]